VADDPQQTIRELKTLVVEYTKQETLDPLIGLGRYAGFGVGGAVLLGVGYLFVAMGSLRILQTETGTTFTGNWSWVPYAIVVAGSAVIAGLIYLLRVRRTKKR